MNSSNETMTYQLETEVNGVKHNHSCLHKENAMHLVDKTDWKNYKNIRTLSMTFGHIKKSEEHTSPKFKM